MTKFSTRSRNWVGHKVCSGKSPENKETVFLPRVTEEYFCLRSHILNEWKRKIPAVSIRVGTLLLTAHANKLFLSAFFLV